KGESRMNTNEIPKPRPYWHVDAKWISGILLLFLLNVTFPLFILARITAPEQGIEILTVILANSFSREGLDQEVDLEILKQKIAESPDGSWQPIPGLNILVREQDIAGLSAREMRLWLFRQLAEPIYYEGEQGLASLSTDPEMQKNMGGDLGLIGIINAETHSQLNKALMVMGLISLALLSLLVYFSYRFGRLGSPGCVIFLAALPGVISFSMLRGWLENGGRNPDPQAAESTLTVYTQLATRLAKDILPDIVQKGLQTYLLLTLLGFGLMLAALIGILIVRGRRREKSSA
ncbi:MAG TPA: hypothetical protein VFI68_02370, partial [Anaerolineales bacterium]|nr:hypothetical protein [Anaerolineales bacterium]